MKKDYPPVDYTSYLALDKILNSQFPKSNEIGEPAHDETLFIIIHQTYELWFKQILHELDSVIEMFRRNYVDEKSIGAAVSRLQRIIEIEKILIDQIRVLETMTPLDFLEFRNLLTPASGFQSIQFRMIEMKLGLKVDQRIKYSQRAYYELYAPEQQEFLLALEQSPSLFDLLQTWLERTPFLSLESFDFVEIFQDVVKQQIQEERELIHENSQISAEEEKQRLQLMHATEKHFESLFDKEKHQKMVREGRRRLSYEATIASLFIHLYRDQPILHGPYNLISALVDIDELISTWRYRHALMVLRMIGRKTGTGGSAGYSYLKTTAENHRVFSDFFNLSTFLIPRSTLPDLPPSVSRNLGFYFSEQGKK